MQRIILSFVRKRQGNKKTSAWRRKRPDFTRFLPFEGNVHNFAWKIFRQKVKMGAMAGIMKITPEKSREKQDKTSSGAFFSFAKKWAKEYRDNAMADIVFAGILGLAFGALQLFLMRRVIGAQSQWQRVLFMALKLPLWALAFVGIVLWWGVGPLVAFGVAAGALYLVAAIFVYIRTHPIHQKGE